MEDENENGFTLHTEIGQEARRLLTHPVQEIERLEHEAEAGEADTTPALLIGGIGVFVSLLVVVVIVVGFAAARLFGSLYGA
jgi:hypothetical protein